MAVQFGHQPLCPPQVKLKCARVKFRFWCQSLAVPNIQGGRYFIAISLLLRNNNCNHECYHIALVLVVKMSVICSLYFQDDLLINLVIEQIITDSELGCAVQLISIIKILIDPENMLPNSANVSVHQHCVEIENILIQINFFKKSNCKIMISNLLWFLHFCLLWVSPLIYQLKIFFKFSLSRKRRRQSS